MSAAASGYKVGFMNRGTFALLRFFVGKLGLTVVLVRSGLALNWHAIRPTLGRTNALAFLPFGVESVVSAAMAYTLFHEQYSHN